MREGRERSARRRWQRCAELLVLAAMLGGAMAGHAANGKARSAARVDLNSASIEQLTTLPGIGPATAKAIVQFREKSGPFERVEDLLAIRGISRRRLERLRPLVTVTPAKSEKATKPASSHRSENNPKKR
jgi:competence protein ComEA